MVNPDCKFILGGVHPSAQPDHTLQFCDYVVQGEGEMPLVEILQGKVRPGIVRMPYIANLDSLPLPDRHFINQERNIQVAYRDNKERIGSIFSSRGCPWKCQFCSSHEVWGRQARYHTPKRVVEEMEYLLNHWHIDFIKFSDDTFTASEDRVARICELITNNGLIGNMEWGCNIRANTSDHLLKKMKEAGCREVWIGAESGSQRILKEMKKGISPDMIKHIFDVTKRLDLYRRVYFMLGWPSETEEDIKLTEELARQIDADQYGFSSYAPFPNNSIFKKEMLDTVDWSRVDEYDSPFASEQTKTWQKKLISEFQDRMCYRQKVN